jgi:hypothetical protein
MPSQPFLPPPQQKKAPKIKIEFDDPSGAKYSFSVEGGVSKEKMVKLMEFVEQISSSGTPSEDYGTGDQVPDYSNIDTNFARVYGLLETKFKFGSFTSSDVLEAYQVEYDSPSALSTISTYLSRLTERRLLTRTRNGSGWIYKLARPTTNYAEQAKTPDPGTPVEALTQEKSVEPEQMKAVQAKSSDSFILTP